MLARLFLLVVVTFFAELSLLLWFADKFGWNVALAEVFLSALAGALIVRRETRSILRRQQGQPFVIEPPSTAVLHSVLIVLAGFLLILPGLITDTLGLLLLIPLFRRMLGLGVAAWIHRRFKITSFQPSQGADAMYSDPAPDQLKPRIIDVQVIDRPKGDSHSES